jgi:hypothetical protein
VAGLAIIIPLNGITYDAIAVIAMATTIILLYLLKDSPILDDTYLFYLKPDIKAFSRIIIAKTSIWNRSMVKLARIRIYI